VGHGRFLVGEVVSGFAPEFVVCGGRAGGVKRLVGGGSEARRLWRLRRLAESGNGCSRGQRAGVGFNGASAVGPVR